MKILVVGGGGREHAIIKKIKENDTVEEIFALPGNGGMAHDATIVPIGAKDIDAIVAFAVENKIDYAVVAPDDPLVLGCVDALEAVGIPCFGPRANAAIIEGSKVFSKNLMKKYGIPTAEYEVFSDIAAALEYLETAPIPTVIKADGLALGKGVIIAMTRDEAKAAVRSMMEDKIFGESGSNVVAICHDNPMRTSNPDGGDYVQHQPHLVQGEKGKAPGRDKHQQTVDHLLFLSADIAVEKGKATGGMTRTLYTGGLASMMAKSRTAQGQAFDVYADSIFDWTQIIH